MLRLCVALAELLFVNKSKVVWSACSFSSHVEALEDVPQKCSRFSALQSSFSSTVLKFLVMRVIAELDTAGFAFEDRMS